MGLNCGQGWWHLWVCAWESWKPHLSDGKKTGFGLWKREFLREERKICHVSRFLDDPTEFLEKARPEATIKPHFCRNWQWSLCRPFQKGEEEDETEGDEIVQKEGSEKHPMNEMSKREELDGMLAGRSDSKRTSPLPRNCWHASRWSLLSWRAQGNDQAALKRSIRPCSPSFQAVQEQTEAFPQRVSLSQRQRD